MGLTVIITPQHSATISDTDITSPAGWLLEHSPQPIKYITTFVHLYFVRGKTTLKTCPSTRDHEIIPQTLLNPQANFDSFGQFLAGTDIPYDKSNYIRICPSTKKQYTDEGSEDISACRRQRISLPSQACAFEKKTNLPNNHSFSGKKLHSHFVQKGSNKMAMKYRCSFLKHVVLSIFVRK